MATVFECMLNIIDIPFCVFRGSANKYAGSMAMDIDQSVHAPANGALHTGDSCLASTRRAETLNGRNKELSSPQDGLCLNQRNQTYASEVLEVACLAWAHCFLLYGASIFH
jgi:hypothetical protein